MVCVVCESRGSTQSRHLLLMYIKGAELCQTQYPTIYLFIYLAVPQGLVLVALYHKGCVICISEVTDISPSNPDSSLGFIQPSVSHDVLCI